MVKGFINSVNRRKGFGFITTEEGEEVFFPLCNLDKEVLLVEFDFEESQKGLKAKNVRRRLKK